MKLLVTGGAGFIGSNFIRYWLTRHPSDSIVNLDLLTYAARLENLSDLAHQPNYQFIQGDIVDPPVVAKAMAGTDVVVHFAAETHVDRSIEGPAEFVRTNVVGTQVLLDAALKEKVQRFHHISTDEVFGSLELDDSATFSETTPYNPSSPYSAAKAGSDFLVRSYGHTFGLPFTISNCTNNYGPYQFPEKLIPLMVLNALQDKALPVYGDGKNVRDWIHVNDHSRAIELILEKGKEGETYCVGGNAERNNLQIVRSILAELGKPESLIQFVEDRKGHDRRYAISGDKIKKELGYEPAYTFESGLAETISWYKEHMQDYV
jgi:dTDP-glucose 4,6-dehydratase